MNSRTEADFKFKLLILLLITIQQTLTADPHFVKGFSNNTYDNEPPQTTEDWQSLSSIENLIQEYPDLYKLTSPPPPPPPTTPSKPQPDHPCCDTCPTTGQLAGWSKNNYFICNFVKAQGRWVRTGPVVCKPDRYYSPSGMCSLILQQAKQKSG